MTSEPLKGGYGLCVSVDPAVEVAAGVAVALPGSALAPPLGRLSPINTGILTTLTRTNKAIRKAKLHWKPRRLAITFRLTPRCVVSTCGPPVTACVCVRLPPGATGG